MDKKEPKKPLRGANRLSFGTKGVPRTQDLPPKNPRKGYGGVSRGAPTAFRRATYDGAGGSLDGLRPGADRIGTDLRTQGAPAWAQP